MPTRLVNLLYFSSTTCWSALNRAVEPSLNTASTSSRCSLVVWYLIEKEPQELFPIMPPSIQRLVVAVSGPNCRLNREASRFSVSLITHGSTLAVLSYAPVSRQVLHTPETSK